MARYNKFSSRSPMSFYKVVFIVFAMAFGLMALALGYQGVKSSLELRSKAAQQTVEYKRWDFKETVEGWKGEKIAKMGVQDGILTIGLGSGEGNISTSGINAKIPKGNKYLELRIAVGPSLAGDNRVDLVAVKPTCSPGEKCVKVTPKPPLPNKFVFTIIYNTGTGDESSPKELTVGGVADGEMRDYKVHLAGNIPESTINNITITFDRGVVQGDQILVDYIKLTGPVVRPTPKPTCTQPPPCAAQGCKYVVQGVEYCQITPKPCTCPNSTMVCPKGDRGLCPESTLTPTITIKLTPTPTCTPKPPCVDGVLDPNTGATLYCDVAPGVVFCPSTPTPKPPACYCPGTNTMCPSGDIGLCPDVMPTTTVICSEDLKKCPNGSYVGRIGPNCVFAPCPGRLTPTPTPSQIGCAEDTMRCSSGIYVGRVGPNCNFAPCPTQTQSTDIRALICSLGLFPAWCAR